MGKRSKRNRSSERNEDLCKRIKVLERIIGDSGKEKYIHICFMDICRFLRSKNFVQGMFATCEVLQAQGRT